MLLTVLHITPAGGIASDGALVNLTLEEIANARVIRRTCFVETSTTDAYAPLTHVRRQVDNVMIGLDQLHSDLETMPANRMRLEIDATRTVQVGSGAPKDLDVELRVFRNILCSVLEHGQQWRRTSGSDSGITCPLSHVLTLRALGIADSEDTHSSAPSTPHNGHSVGRSVYRERATLSDETNARTDEKPAARHSRSLSRCIRRGLQHNLKAELQQEHEATLGLVAWAKEATRDRTHVVLLPTPWSRPSKTDKTQRHITFHIAGSSVAKTESDGPIRSRRLTPTRHSATGLRRSVSTESLGACILRSSDSFSTLKNTFKAF